MFTLSIKHKYSIKSNIVPFLTRNWLYSSIFFKYVVRSDIFPFLDRVTYLCLGDVVYTGSTRLMLDYFRGIGFPCPELENPLMYYREYAFP